MRSFERPTCPDALNKLGVATNEAIFLFDEAIEAYIRDLMLKGIALKRGRLRAERRPETADPDAAWAEYEEALDALLKASEEIRVTFKPYFQV
jgi:hypothetical protein